MCASLCLREREKEREGGEREEREREGEDEREDRESMCLCECVDGEGWRSGYDSAIRVCMICVYDTCVSCLY